MSAIRGFLKYDIKGKSNWYIAHCPLLSRCPLFGVSAKRGFTILRQLLIWKTKNDHQGLVTYAA